jgi:hypothetical protein
LLIQKNKDHYNIYYSAERVGGLKVVGQTGISNFSVGLGRDYRSAVGLNKGNFI